MEQTTKRIIIAIDGFSSCGKSTFAQAIAARIGYIFIDTGAMYRTVTLYAMRSGFFDGNEVDQRALIAKISDIKITFTFNPTRGASDIFLDGENVENEIRTIEVSSKVSRISQIGEVRAELVRQQQKMGADRGIVMDGRDIGTVVFPDAELKIFMTADSKVRAQRRYKELAAKGETTSLEEIEANIRQRDELDQNRVISPLRKADDAITLDNSYMTVDEQIEWVMKYIELVMRA